MSEPRQLVIVTDGNDDALYIDGDLWEEQEDSYLYATELVKASEGKPCVLKTISLTYALDEWPDSLEEALLDPETS